jgi:hypothetical protein
MTVDNGAIVMKPHVPDASRLAEMAELTVLASLLLAAVCGALACGGKTPDQETPDAGQAAPGADPGADARTGATPDAGSVAPPPVGITVIADATARLRAPRDLAFNPRRPTELWVVNGADNAVVILHDATTTPRPEWRRDRDHTHFMPSPTAIAFGADVTTTSWQGTFATIHESNNGGNEFMGPVLWSSALEVFARMNGPLGSHLDMLHCSSFSMGIAWERDNVYWVFTGSRAGGRGDSDLTRYDFGQDHHIGHDDHADNTKHHYARGQIRRVPGVPSHLAFHAPSKTLFIADTGNARVARLDTTSGTPGAVHAGPERTREDRMVEGALLTDLVPQGVLTLPSGIEIKDDAVFVSDNETGIIHVFDLATGAERRRIPTGLRAGALMGIAFGPDGKLYFVDAIDHRILRGDG